ncbi:adenylate and guanylate cyclase catalytic domain-containing protein [Chytriomyces sp. MP71]|nr:adenylate and guanylate cyclase catalytic domain-containing protein [Chytriomyces sp. MP71]
MQDDERIFNLLVNEMKSLKFQSDENIVAASKARNSKFILIEKRNSARQYLARIEAQQERERRALTEKQTRLLKRNQLSRNLRLKEIEDAEIRVILKGHSVSSKTLAEENVITTAMNRKESKTHQANLLCQLRVNQKEIEHLRESHRLQQKYIERHMQLDIEFAEENNDLCADHIMKERQQEHLVKLQEDTEETLIRMKILNLENNEKHKYKMAFSAQAAKRERTELKERLRGETLLAKKREQDFWDKEVTLLKKYLKSHGIQTEGSMYETYERKMLPEKPKVFNGTSNEESSDIEPDDDINASSKIEINIEAVRAREIAVLESLQSSNKQAIKRLKLTLSKIINARLKEQQKELAELAHLRDRDIIKLKAQQENERLYGVMPKFAADVLKAGLPLDPQSFKCLAFINADITSFSRLCDSHSPHQVISLLTRLYLKLDNEIHLYQDLHQLESKIDTYNCVVGLNTQNATPKSMAITSIEWALRVIEVFQVEEVSNMKVDKMGVRIGVHVGPGAGGLVNPPTTKYTVIGDSAVIANELDFVSKPNQIRISDAVHSLVQDVFECEVAESILVLGDKQKLGTWWVVAKK